MALNFLLKRSGTADKRPDPASMSLGELDLNYNATAGGVFYKNSDGNLSKVGSAQVSSTVPNAIPVGSAGNCLGELWYDTIHSDLKVFNGTTWVSSSGDYLPLSGGTMTGPIVFAVGQTFPAFDIDDATTSRKGVVQIGANISVSSGVISVIAGTTSVAGVLQLTDSVSSTSITTAATPNSVKTAYDLANAAMPKSGGTFSGDIYLYSQVPTSSDMPASKYYADQIASGYKWQTAVAAATTAAFAGTVTYNNGTSGVGATLTLGTPITTIDGVTITTVGTRILVKNQATQFQNGIYTYTSGGATTVLTRATDSDQVSELAAGNAYYVTGGTVNGSQTYVQIPTITSVGVSAITYSLTSVKPFHKYSREWNVDPVAGSDTAGTGSEEQPYLTIAKALTMAAGDYGRIVLHQGSYAETLTITNQNLDIVGANRGGATITGTVNFANTASSIRVSGIQFSSTVTHSGAGSLYLASVTMGAGVYLNKTGSGYCEVNLATADTATMSVTGSGSVLVMNSRLGGVTVNNASASVTLQDMNTLGPTTLTLGVMQVIGGTVFAATETGNAITSSAGTNIYLRNSNFVTPLGAVARLSLSGNYSLNDVVFDRANSTLGTNLGVNLARFDSIDVLGPVYANGTTGTNGQILTSAGSGSAPTWTNPGVQGVTGTSPISVDNTDPKNPIVSATAASTSAPGVVQLNDTVASTSTTQALTANQGYNLQQQINALTASSNLTLAGTIDASTGNLASVTAAGTAKGFTVGQPLPTSTNNNKNYFVMVTVAGTMTPPGGTSQVCHQGDWWISGGNGTGWIFADVGFNATYATTTTPGLVQLATDSEVQAGTNTDHAVTPSGLQSKISDSTSTTSSTTIASSTAVKSAYDAALPKSAFTAVGDILSGSGSGTYTALPLGVNGNVLTADSSCSGGVKWAPSTGGTSSVTTYNQLITMNSGDNNALLFQWPVERGSTSYLKSGNVSAMAYITIGEGTNGATPIAWAMLFISTAGGAGLSQIVAADTTGGIFSILGGQYPQFSDTLVMFSPTVSPTETTTYIMNLSLNWFGGFAYEPTIYGTPAS